MARSFLPLLLITLFLTVSASSAAAAACTDDAQCKGERVCTAEGTCAAPPEKLTCSVDVDCPGEELCTDGYCTSPNVTKAEPAAAEPMTPKPEAEPAPAQANVAAAGPIAANGNGRQEAGKIKGFSAGARLAYGLPFGDVGQNAPLDDFTSGQVVPIWLDAGYRLSEESYLGVYLSYGISDEVCADETDFLDDGTAVYINTSDCSGEVVRLGANYHHTFQVEKAFPWIGLGAGYEWYAQEIAATSTANDPDVGPISLRADTTSQVAGFEFLNLQSGVDWALGNGFYAGPFLTLTASRYASAEFEISSPDGEFASESFDENIPDRNKRLHYWGFFGVRVTYN